MDKFAEEVRVKLGLVRQPVADIVLIIFSSGRGPGFL